MTRIRSVMNLNEKLRELEQRGDPRSIKGMARFGIQTERTFGVAVPELRALAHRVGTNHVLAGELWNTGIHEARLLAGMIDDPGRVTEEQMDNWAKEFDSWDVVDQCCGNLFDKTPFAIPKALEWSSNDREYVKRAGFVLMAELAVHDKKAIEKTFREFLPAIVREATDERNFVKKAVSWALRQIGKRNLALNEAAIETAKVIQKLDSRSARWIASDALRELTGDAVQKKLKKTTESTTPKRSS